MNDTSRQKHAKMVTACIASPSCCSRPSSVSTPRSRRLLFGAAVDDDGNPLYDVVTCGARPTDPVAVDRRIRRACPPPGRRRWPTADTVVVPGTRYPPARDRRRPDPRTRGRAGRDPSRHAAGVHLHRRVRAGGGRSARRPARDDALEVRRRAATAAPRGARRRERAVRRRRRRADLGGPGRRNRPVPAHHSAPTTARRWPMRWPDTAWCRRGARAVRRSSSTGRCRSQDDSSTAPTREWALAPSRRGADRASGWPGTRT